MNELITKVEEVIRLHVNVYLIEKYIDYIRSGNYESIDSIDKSLIIEFDGVYRKILVDFPNLFEKRYLKAHIQKGQINITLENRQ